MSEREVRRIIERFCREFDEGKLETALHRLRKLATPPLVGLSLGLAVAGSGEETKPVPDRGGYADYAAPPRYDIPKVPDQGGYADYMAPIKDKAIPEKAIPVPDKGGYADYMAPIKDKAAPEKVPVPDKGGFADYTAPFKG